ncbi:MAG: SLC26A/SulP transporter family protein, partial [Myxococcales bacterium]|nr:SLC26A/SulP transporter family protein [Myxococcales bacterium]
PLSEEPREGRPPAEESLHDTLSLVGELQPHEAEQARLQREIRASSRVAKPRSPTVWRRAKVATGDLWGGLAAAAVVLPQAMAFGVALFVPAGLPASSGAIAGLIGAAALSLSSGLSGGTAGLISAPTGPTLVLQVAALTALGRAGLSGEGVLTGFLAVLLLTGILQALIGISGGGRLIKFIPHPVVAGFMTGSAILMILSQRSPLSGTEVPDPWDTWRWMPAATALVTYLVVVYAPRVLPKVPGTVAGLVGGTAFFHLISWGLGRTTPSPWVIGQLPGLQALQVNLHPSGLASLPWPTVLASAATLAVLASLDTLLTSVVADVTTRQRHDARRELVGQGVGQVLAGLFGGMAGAGTTGATVVATNTGGRRWVGVVAGLTFFLLLAVGGPVGAVLPVSVLGGIILRVAVHMVDRDVFTWLRRRRTRMDAGIAVMVATVTVAYDLMVAVGVGMAVAIGAFIRAQIQSPVIHRRSTGRQRRSVRHRPSQERALLEQHGDRIVLYELKGSLFFATADRLFGEVMDDLCRPAWVIFDMARVRSVDLTGVKILEQMAARLEASGGQLCFCTVHSGAGLGKKVKKTFKKVSPGAPSPSAKTFNGPDEALRYAEDELLRSLGHEPAAARDAAGLEANDLCRSMDAGEVAVLQAVLRSASFPAGAVIFNADDMGRALFVVLRGEVETQLPTTEHHHTRLAAYPPGTFFGEVAFLSPGPRAATAVAISDVEALELDREDFDLLRVRRPDVGAAVLLALARAQGAALRWSAAELRRMSEW